MTDGGFSFIFKTLFDYENHTMPTITHPKDFSAERAWGALDIGQTSPIFGMSTMGKRCLWWSMVW